MIQSLIARFIDRAQSFSGSLGAQRLPGSLSFSAFMAALGTTPQAPLIATGYYLI
jgi:hypothetical protein